MSELKPCPFCGGEAELCYSEVDTFCRKCNVIQETEMWNTRPIEDELRARIAELEMNIRHNALWQASEDAEERAHLEKLVPDLKKRIAELEAESERFTVHSRIKRQDDKWIPVSERLPEKQKLTIGFTDNSAYVFFEIVNDDEMGLVMYPYQNRKGTVTHWMPLPSTPEVQE